MLHVQIKIVIHASKTALFVIPVITLFTQITVCAHSAILKDYVLYVITMANAKIANQATEYKMVSALSAT